MGRTILEINVADVEKRKIPTKHYVYVVYVTWSDSSTNVIYRRYSRFFDFQSRIMELFPEESGTIDPEKRIIPFLPGKKFFGRSHIREVAVKRLAPIAEYCKSIVKLPRKISQSKDVLEFFEIEPDDINPPKGKKASIKGEAISGPKPLEVYIVVTDYKKQEKGEVTLKVGMYVEIVEKTETGWWFVNVEEEQGWVPSTCLERENGVKEDSTIKFRPGEEEQYLCTEEFRAQGEDELSMERGAVVDVLEKNLEGWWRVRYNGKEGYVPATYLMKTESFKIRKQKPEPGRTGGPQIVRSLQEVSDLLQNKSSSTHIASDDMDDEFDDDGDNVYEEPEEERIYTIQELSKILREDKKNSETEEVYESIQNMKSRSLKRGGSVRPPPRPPVKPKLGGKSPLTVNTPPPPVARTESVNKGYITIADFSDAVGDGISFQAGQSVKVLEKSEGGWWYIELEGKEGWAPASYIQEMSSEGAQDRLPVLRHPKQKSKSHEGSLEDLTESDQKSESPRRLSAVESIGGLANALKAKITQKGNKPPPTPPKKDFLETPEDIQSRYITPIGDESIGNDTMKDKAAELGDTSKRSIAKKPFDRSSLQAPPPAPAFKHTSKPEPPDIPKFSLPGKGQNEGSMGQAMRTRPKPPAKTVKSPAVDEDPGEVRSSVAGLAGALKAKFEERTVGQNKPQPPNVSQKPKLTGSVSTGVKPKVDTHGKPAVKPSPGAKPELKPVLSKPEGSMPAKPPVPNVSNKPNISTKPQPPNASKPSWVKSETETKPGKVNQNRESSNQKVSDLTSMLQSKFENRNKPNDTDTNANASRTDTKYPPPAAPAKPVTSLKPSVKPPRPSTPPSPRMGARTWSPTSAEGRSLSPLSNRAKSTPDGKNLDPQKYSARPLPPMPGGKPKLAGNTKPEANEQKPFGATAVPSVTDRAKAVNTNISSGGSDADSTRSVGVSGLANALKAKLGANMIGSPSLGGENQKTPSAKAIPQVPSKPKADVGKSVHSISVSDDKENNNTKPHIVTDNTYCATTDYDGTDGGAISLKMGEHVEVLETADGWWFVSSGNLEGWVPSAYLEKAKPSTHCNLDSKSDTGARSSRSKDPVFHTISDFVGENEGELSVEGGKVVTVLDAPEGGWWFIRVDRQEGWIPASYLEEK